MAFTVTETNLIYRCNRGCGVAAVVMLVGVLRYVFCYIYTFVRTFLVIEKFVQR